MTIDRDRILANHIYDAVDAIEMFVAGLSIVQFAENDLIKSAVVKKFEIIGEAAKQLSDDFRAKHSKIPWKDIVGMRNVLIHDYMGIDYESVWNTIEQYIPELKRTLRPLSFTKSEKEVLSKK